LTWAAESSVHPGCVRPAARVISRGEGSRLTEDFLDHVWQ
jgi:hypothetical protein